MTYSHGYRLKKEPRRVARVVDVVRLTYDYFDIIMRTIHHHAVYDLDVTSRKAYSGSFVGQSKRRKTTRASFHELHQYVCARVIVT